MYSRYAHDTQDLNSGSVAFQTKIIKNQLRLFHFETPPNRGSTITTLGEQHSAGSLAMSTVEIILADLARSCVFFYLRGPEKISGYFSHYFSKFVLVKTKTNPQP